MNIRLPYKALTEQNNIQYNQYLLMKAYADGNTQKNGFIKKTEVQIIADHSQQSKHTLVNKLRTLTSTGFIEKNQYGYVLTSKNKINQNLNLTSTNKEGRTRTPFFKIELSPSIDNSYQLELMKLY